MQAFRGLDQFHVPAHFRARNAFLAQLWWMVRSSIFKDVPAGVLCPGSACRPVRPRLGKPK